MELGKSSLVNLLDPDLILKTAEISEQSEQGQHTTTFAEMFDLKFGASIIDSPGIKGFGLIDIEKNELGDYFPEFIPYINQIVNLTIVFMKMNHIVELKKH